MENSGYTTDIEYTSDFYGDWSLSNLALQCALKGIQMPNIQNACELGFGQGVNLNVMAASSDVLWHGTDFLSAHADNAKRMAQACDNPVKIYNLSFEYFVQVDDLPNFDLIVLHGVFSWVSSENQGIIIDFITKHLSETGMVYISYNARPGSDVFKPAQYLMNQLRKEFSKNHSEPEIQIQQVTQFMQQFHQTTPGYLKAFPSIEKRVQGMQNKDPKYLIHEYFNADWNSFFFSEISQFFEPIGLKYLGQTRLTDELAVLNFSQAQQLFLEASKAAGALEQDLKDAMCNRQFRRDIWIKAPSPMNGEALQSWLETTAVMLATPYTAMDLKLTGAIGSATMDNERYKGLLDRLSDYQAHRLDELLQKLSLQTSQLMEMLGLLHCKGVIGLTSIQVPDDQGLNRCQRLNQEMVSKAVQNNRGCLIVLPKLGLCLNVDYWVSLYLHLYFSGEPLKQDPLECLYNYLQINSVTVLNNGQPLTEENDIRLFLEQTVRNIQATTVLEFFAKHQVIAG
ncbi:methyltransferase [Thiosulfatimonas sediminis]|uniref:Methyltransferase n=1 Tax=Thiosulfatimonas sediminis TaxID=2675054 RepID=A0A6F8PSK1_9GAMM|nr:methyltransferase regulatory domain-containing protein [Thiosulfatimonas sediminis]BBP45112.1 methyltransferase [Thiosulfatimonas sediminis]